MSGPPLLPLSLDVRGRRVVVVGAGSVGRRKIARLLEAGARVRVVALETASIADVEWITAPFAAELLDGCQLAIAAATPEVNRSVVAAAEERGIWVNCASPGELGSAHFPAVVQCGRLQLAIGTGGAGPAFAAQIRRQLELQFDSAYALWADALALYRERVLAEVPSLDRRTAPLRQAAEPHWLEAFRTGAGQEAVARWNADLQDE